MTPPPGRLLLALALAAAAVLPKTAGPAAACTAFRIDAGGGAIVGRNYDWSVGTGLVLVNKRNVSKSFGLVPEAETRRWTSRYGSVTFNQYGRDLPQGGINEKGLVVAILWLAGTEYPPPDDRPAVGTTQWIQYQLDTAADVPEVIASLDRVRIQSRAVEIHYFISDREGRSASVEFLGGRPVCRSGETMPAPTLTNHPYEASLAYLRRHRGWGGDAPPARGERSLDRFVRASTGAASYERGRDGDPVAFAFDVLAEVAQGDRTQWSIVYDLERLRVHWRTHRQREVRTVDLNALDFDCARPVLMVDINAEAAESGAPRWTPYTRTANLDLVTESYRRTSFLEDISRENLERVADYPEGSICVP